MRWFRLSLYLLCGIIGLTDAGVAGWQSRDSNYNIAISGAAPSYTGPGDIVASATAWYGLRAYNAAYATGSNNAINVRRASDNSTQNIVILSTGALDITTANTFAGTDATASCTIATTVATCTGASSTPHTGSTITGSGVQNPCYIVSVGSFAGGAGTVNLGGGNGSGSAPCGTISVAVTLTFQYGLYVATLYDQSGANACSSAACNATQSTAANQPQLLPNCIGSLPCVKFLPTANGLFSAAAPLATSPITITSVNEPTVNDTNQKEYFSVTSDLEIGYKGTNLALCYNGSVSNSVTATVSQWHSLNTVINGASGVTAVDGVETASTNCGSNNPTSYIGVGNYGSGYSFEFVGYQSDIGMWSNKVFNSTQRTNICQNAQAYYGASNFGATC